jgi:hypothetical protein
MKENNENFSIGAALGTIAACALGAFVAYELIRYKKNKDDSKNLVRVNYVFSKDFFD